MESLTEDEFRVLAYIRAYADGPFQHLSPVWIADQLNLSEARFRAAVIGLEAKKLADIYQFTPPHELLANHPNVSSGPILTDITLTAYGWNFLRGRIDGSSESRFDA